MINLYLSYLVSYIGSVRLAFVGFLNDPSGLYLFPVKRKLGVFIILTLLSALVYLNTLGHQMAYDDEQVIRKNEFVLKGMKGIPDILTHDSYFSFYHQSNLENILPGGRYRPLSIISFAIEQQLVGTKHDSVPAQFIWDVNGNGVVDPDEDVIKDNVLTPDDFFARGLGLRHFLNLCFYALCVGLLYVFFAKYVPAIDADVLFLAAILFAVHPIHTEVVANIKSRDEIFSLFFIALSFLFGFRYLARGYKLDACMFSVVFFLALLSKEFAILLLLFIPVMVYLFKPDFKDWLSLKIVIAVSLTIVLVLFAWLFHESYWFWLFCLLYLAFGVFLYPFKGLSTLIWLMGLSFGVYLVLRLHATADVGNIMLFKTNIISNPYLLATAEQTWATKLFILIKYVGLLFVPYPLISDYSFSSIAYRDFRSWEVWVSIVFYIILIVSTVVLFLKKKPLAFPFILFLGFLLPVSNLFVDIGAPMGERLVFHASLGFCLAVSWPLNMFKNTHLLNRLSIKIAVSTIIGLIIAVFLWLTFHRNREWENNQTLFAADHQKVPQNMVLLSGQARNLYLNAEKEPNKQVQQHLVHASIDLVDKGLQQNGAYLSFYQTLALDFYLLKEYDKAISSARAGLKLESRDFTLNSILLATSKEYINKGLSAYHLKQTDEALKYFEKAIKCDSMNTDAYYNKAYVFKSIGDTLSAIKSLKQGLLIAPKKELKKLLHQLDSASVKY